jgi:hypothetical protein
MKPSSSSSSPRVLPLPQDIKNDLYAALELNESAYAKLNSSSDPNEASASACTVTRDQVNIVCEIRARLMQALTKATAFFETNIELLATIATLKKESAIYREKQQCTNDVLNGRISTLMEIVREQQESLERKQETLALKGVWANLLQVSPDGNVRRPVPIERHEQQEQQRRREREGILVTAGSKGDGDMDEYAANVLTWLSLQCAQEAQSRFPQSHQHHDPQQRQNIVKLANQSSSSSTGSLSNSYIDQELHGIDSVSELVQKVGGLFRALDAKSQARETENSTMRVRLQELSAICTALRRERDEKDGEIERWKDAIRYSTRFQSILFSWFQCIFGHKPSLLIVVANFSVALFYYSLCSVLQTDHEYSTNQLSLLTAENNRLRASNEVEKENCQNWRTKCHEILEAVEKTTVANSLLTSNISQNVTSQPSISPITYNKPVSSLRQREGDSSSSTFYSNQQFLFSPPTESSLHHSSKSTHDTRKSENSRSYGSTPAKYSLDAYYCDLIEQADVVNQSPPTPFVVDAKRTPQSDKYDRLTSPQRIKNLCSDTSNGLNNDSQNASSPCRISPVQEMVNVAISSTSPEVTAAANKVIEPIDPRELDDSTLYKMMLEAENEIDNLSSDENSVEGERKRRQRESNFQNSVDLCDAIAHGRELMTTAIESPGSEKSPPKSRSKLDIPIVSNSRSPAQFESSSYNTPNKSRVCASNHFSQSLQLKQISASKSAATTEWTQHFTRGHVEKEIGESPYDKVLRRPKCGAGSIVNSNENAPLQLPGDKELLPISPIPHTLGQ